MNSNSRFAIRISRGGEEAAKTRRSPSVESSAELARKIRKAIIDDKNLSLYAHNVKVIARGGTVTLKGPVPSDEEKTAIESKAVEIAGAVNVKDELTGKSKTEK